MKGTVICVGKIFWGFGKNIITDNGNNIQTIYAHLDKIYVYTGKKSPLQMSLEDKVKQAGQRVFSFIFK
jgi:hypothetical protein